tara:strand:+ start:233 stop:451 length:219 start_codon:yes stop_codon:yes gene_type:complete
MGVSIDFIANLPRQLQEDILQAISSKIDKEYPVEINDKVYFVEKPVSNLIKSLTEKCYNYKSIIDEYENNHK